MSAPSASGGSKLPGAQNVATPQSNPQFYTLSSPAPRSAPSPATNRTQAGKSPFPGTLGTNAGGTANSVAASSKTVDASPGNLPHFDSPAGMVPSLSNMGFGDGGFNMALGASGMGGLNMSLGASLSGRIDEHERRRRLETIVAKLRTRYPRLSPEGVELVGQRLDMDILLDPPQGTRRDGTRTCTLAGDTIAVEIGFRQDNRVDTVEVSAPGTSDVIAQHIQSASAVLKSDLTEPDMQPILRKLDKFSNNLERLAKLDKLNASTKSETFSCFEAISGVYSSLKRLFEHEKKTAEALIDAKKSNREARIEREVMCKKSGRPVMNNRGVIGLSLDYWMQKRVFFPPSSHKSTNTDAMELDQKPQTDPSLGIADQKVFSLLIECEGCPSEIYPPVRVSDAWLPDTLDNDPTEMNDVFGPAIGWLEPPSTYLTIADSTEGEAMALDMSNNKLPNIRFVAKLKPALVLPAQIMEALLASVGLQPEPANMPLYHNALLNITEVDQMEFMGREKTISNRRQTKSRKGNNESDDVVHCSYLTPKNPVFSRTLEEIPFSHPRQIVEMLPIMRQWASINSLLTQSFVSKPTDPNANGVPSSVVDVTFDASLASFSVRFPLGTSILLQSDGALTANGSMTAKLLASQQNSKLHSYEGTFSLGNNGDITLTDQRSGNGVDSTAETDTKQEEEQKTRMIKAARNLDIASDLDVWVEWLKYWISQGQS